MVAPGCRHHGTDGITRPHACAIRHIRPASQPNMDTSPTSPTLMAGLSDLRFQASDGGGHTSPVLVRPHSLVGLHDHIRPARHDMKAVQACFYVMFAAFRHPINPSSCTVTVKYVLILGRIMMGSRRRPAPMPITGIAPQPDGSQFPDQKRKVTARPPPKSVLSLPAVA